MARRSDLAKRVAVILLLPALILLFVAFVLPIVILTASSFHSVSSSELWSEFDIQSYLQFLESPFYLSILARTLRISAITIVVTVVLGYPLAYRIHKSSHKTTWIMLTLSPLLINLLVQLFGWLILLGNNGVINSMLLSLGVISAPLDLLFNETGIAIGQIHINLPFMVLTLLTALEAINPALNEASMNLGANPIRTFFSVIFPLSFPGVLAGIVLVMSLSITNFATPSILGSSRYMVLSTLISTEFLYVGRWPFASAVSIITAILALVLLAVNSFVITRLGRGVFR